MFPLMAIGAGLGLGAEQIQRSQQAQVQAADAMMRRLLLQRQIEDLLRKDRASLIAGSVGGDLASGLGGGLNLPGTTRLPGDAAPGAGVPGAGMPLAGGGETTGARPTAFPPGRNEWLNQNAPFPTLGRPSGAGSQGVMPDWPATRSQFNPDAPYQSMIPPQFAAAAPPQAPPSSGDVDLLAGAAATRLPPARVQEDVGVAPAGRTAAAPPRDLSPLSSVTQLADAGNAAMGYTLQMAQAAPGGVPPGAAAPPAAAPAPPVQTTPPPTPPPSDAELAQIVRRRYPGVDQTTLGDAVTIMRERLDKRYKAEFDRWKGTADVTGSAETRAETARANRTREAQEAAKMQQAAEQFFQTHGLDRRKFDQQADQFAKTHGLDKDKFKQAADQFAKTHELAEKRFGAEQKEKEIPQQAQGAWYRSVLSEPEQKLATDAGKQAVQSVDPMVRGKMHLKALAEQIEKTNPELPDHVKAAALESQIKALAPDQRAMLQAELSKIQRAAAAERGAANVRIVDAEGQVLFQGAAHPNPEGPGYVEAGTGKPLVVPDNATMTISGKGSAGKQAETMMQRITNAGSEIARAIPNMAEMSRTTTTGWFQGIQAETGRGLTEGIRRSLANKITPREAQMMKAIAAGLGRNMAILGSAGSPTGLVGLQKSYDEASQIRAGDDDRSTALVKLAEIRQVVEAAIDASLTSPMMADSPDRKKFLEKIRGQISEAVPWTVLDVIRLTQRPGQESFREFGKRIGLGGGPIEPRRGQPAATEQRGQAGPPAPAGQPTRPVPEKGDLDMLRANPSPEMRTFFDEAFGPGAAARVLGE